MLYNETLLISKAMHKCSGTPLKPLLLESKNNIKLVDILSNNREKFIDYLQELGLNVKHNEKTTNYQNHATTIVTLKTTCFKVDFNDNFAIISPLK